MGERSVQKVFLCLGFSEAYYSIKINYINIIRNNN
jgi:hypothetical protein